MTVFVMRKIESAVMLDVPSIIAAQLCIGCEHGMNCFKPIITDAAASGITCLSYAPVRGEAMDPAHILALPDREPCDDCACRKGTVPNGTPHTIANFIAASDRLEPFLCHEGGANRVCGGWLRAAKAKINKHLMEREINSANKEPKA